MKNLSLDLPVKLEELCKFTFTFNNLIKVINYLHQHNLNLQTEIKDINQRLYIFESLKSDIDDIKIKFSNVQQTNELLNREILHIKGDISKFNNNFIENNKKHEILDEKIKDLENEKNAHDKNLNHLNEVVEENIKKTNYLENSFNADNKRIGKLEEKIEINSKSCDEIKLNIKEINSKLDDDKNKLDNIDNSIKKIIENEEKANLNYLDLNNKVLNIENDVSKLSNQANTLINQKNEEVETENIEKINKRASALISPENLPAFNPNFDSGTQDLIKAIMDEVDEQKIKYNKLKEDLKLTKENQNQQNETFKANISKLLEDMNNIKNDFDENLENIENNINTLSIQKQDLLENKEDNIHKSDSKQIIEPQPDINTLLSKYAPMDSFKKLSDNVRILTSTLNSKISAEDFENRFKKMNVRLEKIEMSTVGQTFGPRPRINLELVNTAMTKENFEIPSEYRGEMEEIEVWAKLIENRLGKNIEAKINKEIHKFENSLNEKDEKLINDYQKNCQDIEKNYKSIIELRNILLNLPTKADVTKLKTDQDKMGKQCRINKIKIEELIKNIEGDPDDEENTNNNNNFQGSVYEKLKNLNQNTQILNSKITILENKNKLITKEVKDEVKQNLKIETSKIMQQFKTRLESFTNRFEYELRNKIDQIGLTDFENKINNKFYIDLKEKLDKNDLKKNNNLLNRKIDNLETKISKTLVDTIIDLQMDDQPLIIKKNANGVDVCASCNQPVAKINMNSGGKDYLNGSTTNPSRAKVLNKSVNFTQPINMKSNTTVDKNNKSNLGQNRLPDIIPNIYQK